MVKHNPIGIEKEIVDPNHEFWDPSDGTIPVIPLAQCPDCPKCGSMWAAKTLFSGYQRPSVEALETLYSDGDFGLENLENLKALLERAGGTVEGEHLVCVCTCKFSRILRPLDYY
jgi:hypothetical protein